MKPGDTVVTSVWLTGKETAALVKQFLQDMFEALERGCIATHGVTLAPDTDVTVLPLDDATCPPVPPHIQGPNVRLLLMRAKVNGYAPRSLFAADLEPGDLLRLRAITRKAYTELMPGYPALTDAQCDTVINDLGPEAAEDSLRSGEVNISKVLH